MTSQGGNVDQVIDGILKEASEQDAPRETENRNNDRHPYNGFVVLILLDQTGNASSPLLLRAEDISTGGIGIVSRHMFHIGSIGAVQMLRSDGKTALIGVKVKHCRYTGDMRHHSGLEFIPVPARIKEAHFTADDGRKPLIHTMMTESRAA